MTRHTALRLTLAAGLTAALIGCGGDTDTSDAPSPGIPGDITENAGPVPQLTDPPSPGG